MGRFEILSLAQGTGERQNCLRRVGCERHGLAAQPHSFVGRCLTECGGEKG